MGLTYAQRLIHGSRMAVGVLIVSITARLAREGGSACPGSNYCCPAKRLHCVGLLSLVVTELAMMSFEDGTCRADANTESTLAWFVDALSHQYMQPYEPPLACACEQSSLQEYYQCLGPFSVIV